MEVWRMVDYNSLCNWERYLLVIMMLFLYFSYTAWRTWVFVYCAVSPLCSGLRVGRNTECGCFQRERCYRSSGRRNWFLYVASFYRCWSMVWNILFAVIVWSSLRWLFWAFSFWIWNLSIVLRWLTFFWSCNTCIMMCMFPKVCPCSIRRAYLELCS